MKRNFRVAEVLHSEMYYEIAAIMTALFLYMKTYIMIIIHASVNKHEFTLAKLENASLLAEMEKKDKKYKQAINKIIDNETKLKNLKAYCKDLLTENDRKDKKWKNLKSQYEKVTDILDDTAQEKLKSQDQVYHLTKNLDAALHIIERFKKDYMVLEAQVSSSCSKVSNTDKTFMERSTEAFTSIKFPSFNRKTPRKISNTQPTISKHYPANSATVGVLLEEAVSPRSKYADGGKMKDDDVNLSPGEDLDTPTQVVIKPSILKKIPKYRKRSFWDRAFSCFPKKIKPKKGNIESKKKKVSYLKEPITSEYDAALPVTNTIKV